MSSIKYLSPFFFLADSITSSLKTGKDDILNFYYKNAAEQKNIDQDQVGG
jgi:hypothetical protein